MVHNVIISERANSQLYRLYDYIAPRASHSIAEKFVNDIQAYCFGFDVFPERGTRRDDLSPGLRLVGFRRTVTISFIVSGNDVVISGIFYGGEDYEDILRIGEA